MTNAARIISEPLGGSPLSLAVQSRSLPQALQPWRPASAADWRAHVERVRTAAPRGWLEAIRPALSASRLAAERLDRVGAGNGIVITTGQQAGLFGGPLYTLTKALTALALADVLEGELGIPVAPVFWAATDDADFLEASRAYVADADGLTELRLLATPAAGTPMSDAPLGDVTTSLARLRQASGSAAHSAYFEMARAAYGETSTIGGAYVHLLRELLEPLGVAVMDSSHAAYQAASRPILLRALECANAVASAASARAAELRALGYEPQVQDDRGLSLVFAHQRGIKRRLSVDEAADFGSSSGTTALSPNVLLRPIVERAMFPTAAYVAGPGELAYFAQINPIAQAIGASIPTAVARWSCTIVEPFVDRALGRLGATPAELRDVPTLERRLATAALTPRVADAWHRLQTHLEAALASLAGAVREDQLVQDAVVDGLRRSLGHRLQRAERRLLAAVKRREVAVRRDLAAASGALYPLGQRQERVLNFIPPLARHGESLLTGLRDGARFHAVELFHGDGMRKGGA